VQAKQLAREDNGHGAAVIGFNCVKNSGFIMFGGATRLLLTTHCTLDIDGNSFILNRARNWRKKTGSLQGKGKMRSS
jgi:hypothetical protein